MSREEAIRRVLSNNFRCDYLEVLNESHQHSVPENSETHFKVTIVSEDFIDKSKVSRHQSIYALTQKMMAEGLHALALHTYVPSEWQTINSLSPISPNCMGGSKSVNH
tara:strand:+ start:41297 stop:41620 length:324 start_codon:yes stop_codon:yes gene_type:complete